MLWANPAAQHSAGKKALAALDDARSELTKLFQLSSQHFQTVYHSGATEGINSAVMGLCFHAMESQQRLLFAYSPLDHACVRAQAARLGRLGHDTVELAVNQHGDLLLADSVARILAARAKSAGPTLINFTWVHNETGVVWPLSLARQLKEQTGGFVHVDAAQAIGKEATCWQLDEELDLYSFSSHKCGGFKGHGWSFVQKTFPGQALILGGGQQQGQRSGTENVLAAQALQIALQEIRANWNSSEQAQNFSKLRAMMDQWLVGIGARVAGEAQQLNSNTILFFLNEWPSDRALPFFDLAGLEVSAGAACSSGAAKANHVLQQLGFEAHAKNGIRLSVGWQFGAAELAELSSRIPAVLQKFTPAK